MGFNCLRATEPLRRVGLLFTTKSPEIPGTHLIDLSVDGVQLLKAKEPLRGDGLLFTTKSPEIPGIHLIDLGKMKGRVDLGAP